MPSLIHYLFERGSEVSFSSRRCSRIGCGSGMPAFGWRRKTAITMTRLAVLHRILYSRPVGPMIDNPGRMVKQFMLSGCCSGHAIGGRSTNCCLRVACFMVSACYRSCSAVLARCSYSIFTASMSVDAHRARVRSYMSDGTALARAPRGSLLNGGTFGGVWHVVEVRVRRLGELVGYQRG